MPTPVAQTAVPRKATGFLAWLKQHRYKVSIVGAILFIVGVVMVILWLKGVGPFAPYAPVYDANTDERVLLKVYNARRAAANLPPVTQVPTTTFDPNGFHGAWAAPPLEIDDPQAYQEMCSPCWLINPTSANPSNDPYQGSFSHGMGTVDKQTIIDNCRYPGVATGQSSFDQWLQVKGASDNMGALQACWNSVCLPTKASRESATAGCQANYFRTTSSGSIIGQGWGTLGDSAWKATMESMQKDSTINKLCPGQTGQAAPKQKLVSFGGTQVPEIYGASAFMQTAFNNCFVLAKQEGVTDPTSLCTNIVLQKAAQLPSSATVASASKEAVTWFGQWKDAWDKVVAERKAQGAAQVYCDEANADTATCCPTTVTRDTSTLPSGCCALPTPTTSDGARVKPPGGCVRLCAVPWVDA